MPGTDVQWWSPLGGPRRAGDVADHRLRVATALANPTRAALYGILEEAADRGDDLDVATLTRLVGVHHTTVRAHLAKLCDADIVTRRAAPPRGRGRPKLYYRAVR